MTKPKNLWDLSKGEDSNKINVGPLLVKVRKSLGIVIPTMLFSSTIAFAAEPTVLRAPAGPTTDAIKVGKKTKKIHKQVEIFKKGSAVGLTAGTCGKVFERRALNVKTGNSAGDATVIGFAIVCGYLIAFTQVAFASSNGE